MEKKITFINWAGILIQGKPIIGVVSLPVDKWLNVGPQITVLRRDIHQQKGLQHQWLSGCRKKAVILHKGAGANEKHLFPVKEPPARLEALIAAESYFFE